MVNENEVRITKVIYFINSVKSEFRRGAFATSVNGRNRVSDMSCSWMEVYVNRTGLLARADLFKPGKVKLLCSFPL